MFCVQGWLNYRPSNEREVIMSLFEGSFNELWLFALQNLEFKMDILECFVISQVSLAVYYFSSKILKNSPLFILKTIPNSQAECYQIKKDNLFMLYSSNTIQQRKIIPSRGYIFFLDSHKEEFLLSQGIISFLSYENFFPSKLDIFPRKD